MTYPCLGHPPQSFNTLLFNHQENQAQESQKSSHQEEEWKSCSDLLMFPLPLGDLVEDQGVFQLYHYQPMYFQYLLRLHPEHPLTMKPEDIDNRILQGPVAQVFLIIRRMMLETSLRFPEESSNPEWLRSLLQCSSTMFTQEYWRCMLVIWMPILKMLLLPAGWTLIHRSLD